MSEHKLHNVVYARLDTIANAEKITRVELAALSREALTYVVETHDIDLVNRLIGVLTPMNRKTAILYFSHFLPWNVEHKDDAFSRFGKMMEQSKKVKKRLKSIADFLSDESNDIWTWAEANIEVEQRQVNVADMLSSALEKAINGVDTDKTHGDPMSKAEIMGVIMQQIDAEEMLNILGDLTVDEQPKAA